MPLKKKPATRNRTALDSTVRLATSEQYGGQKHDPKNQDKRHAEFPFVLVVRRMALKKHRTGAMLQPSGIPATP
jgi:hypothetical protein